MGYLRIMNSFDPSASLACPLHYTFSEHEICKPDIRRFSYLTSPQSYREPEKAIRLLCGAFTLDTELYPMRAYPVPVNDPLFRKFTAKLLKAIPHLAFYIDCNQEDACFRHIVWATLRNIQVIDFCGSAEGQPSLVKPDPAELAAEAHELADAAIEHFRRAGLSAEEIQYRCEAIVTYLTTVD